MAEAEATHLNKSTTILPPHRFRTNPNPQASYLNNPQSSLPASKRREVARESTTVVPPSTSKRAKTSQIISKEITEMMHVDPPASSNLCNDQVDIDPLDMRLSILRQLVPQGSELQEKDDLLKVVFEYVKNLEREVKDLEREIKSFKYEDTDEGMEITSEDMGALQKKGLCIVQLSKLTKAF